MRIESPEPEIIQGQSLRVYGCLSKGRIPLVSKYRGVYRAEFLQKMFGGAAAFIGG